MNSSIKLLLYSEIMQLVNPKKFFYTFKLNNLGLYEHIIKHSVHERKN